MDPVTGAAIISGGASLLGGLFGQSSTAKSARRDIDFQKEMSLNKYQYMMKDMEAAGLNPILAAQGGVPGTGGAGGGQIPYMNPVGEAVNTGLQVQKQRVEERKIDQEIKKMTKEMDKMFTEMGVMEQERKESITREALNKVRKEFETLGLAKQKWEAFKNDKLLAAAKSVINAQGIAEDMPAYDMGGGKMVPSHKAISPSIPHGYLTP